MEKASTHTSQELGKSSPDLSVEEITKQQIVKLLNADEVEKAWPQIMEELDRNPEPLCFYYTKESLFDRVLEGLIHVWAVCPPPDKHWTLVLMTERHMTDIGPQLRILWASGEGAIGALNLIALVLKRFAYETGCVRIFATGRRGWIRALKIFGAQEEGVCMSVAVEPMRRQ